MTVVASATINVYNEYRPEKEMGEVFSLALIFVKQTHSHSTCFLTILQECSR